MTRRLAGALLLAAACSSVTDSTPPDGSTLAAEIGQLDYPAETWLGQTGSRLSYVVRNTGTTRWTFGATASLRKPDHEAVMDLPVSSITLSPGQTRAVSWDLSQWRPAGLWDVRVSVRQKPGESSSNLLADSGWLLEVISTGFWVRYHSSTTGMSQANADFRLAESQRLLRTYDGAGDVACDVTLIQYGSPSSFATGDGIIDNQSEYEAVLAVPGSIKLVNQINWCNAIAAGILGCAPIPGFSSVARAGGFINRDRELWAHEYGHNVGLVHTTTIRYLMYATYDVAEPRNKVSANDCSAYRSGVAAGEPAASMTLGQTLPVQEFVRQAHHHGVSYGEALRYSAMAVPLLLRMLADPTELPYWENIVAMLGIIGAESVVAPLIAFLREGNGTLTPDEYRAKSTVLIALGYVVNHTRSRLALDYLLQSANPEEWNTRTLRWSSPFHATASQRNARLSSTTLLGLALSGAPEAGTLLRSRAMEPGQNVFQEFRAISRLGLARYYARAARW